MATLTGQILVKPTERLTAIEVVKEMENWNAKDW
jgi:hypothetical protein